MSESNAPSLASAASDSLHPTVMHGLPRSGQNNAGAIEYVLPHGYNKRLRMAEMRHIDYGIAVLTAAFFTSFPDNQPFDLADLYSRLVSQNQMVAYEVKQRFYEIGSPEGLAKLDSFLRDKPAVMSR